MATSVFSSPCLSLFLFLSILSTPPPSHSSQASKAHSQVLSDYTSKAQKLFNEGEYSQSRKIFLEVLSLAEKSGHPRDKASAHHMLGIISWNLGSIDTAKYYLESSLSEYQRLKDKNNTSNLAISLNIISLYNTGKLQRQANSLQLSLASYEQAVSLSRQINNPSFLCKCMRQMSLVYWDLKLYQKYYGLCIEALEIAKSANNGRELSYLLNNIGNYFWKVDNYSKALKYYEESLPLALSSNNMTLYSYCLNNIGVVYIDIGNFDKALDYCLRALNNDKSAGDKGAIVIDLINIGVIYRRRALVSYSKDEFNNAIRYLLDCLLLAEQIGDKSNSLIALNNLGTIYSDLNDFVLARSYFNKALYYADMLGDKENRSMVINNLGIIELNMGNFMASTEYFQKAIDIAQQVGTGQVLWEAYFELGNSYAKQKRHIEAFNAYKASIAIIENIRSGIVSEEYKASFMGSDKRLDAYYNVINLLLLMNGTEKNQGLDREAFNYVERAKARAFLDTLELSEIDFKDSADFRLINQEKALLGEVSKAYTKLLNTGLSDEERDSFEKKIKFYEEELEKLKQVIREANPTYANLRYPKIITYDSVQREITKSDTTIIVFALGKDTSVAFAITKGRLTSYPLPPRAEIQRRVSEYRKLISDSNSIDFRPGYELFRVLLKPGLNSHTKKLVIIPDDILHLLPFEALITEPSSNHWVIENYALSYAPSLSSLKYLMDRRSIGRKHKKDLLAFGDPYYGPFEETPANPLAGTAHDFFPSSSAHVNRLIYSGPEVKNLVSLFGKSRIDVYLRQAATEEALKIAPLIDYRIIHFASHAFIDDKKPARSAILLSLDQDPIEDGLLQTREIFNLKIAADLVVLSACQTGLGQFIRGEGIEGLNRAFFYAGASSVLISLWSVNDQATSRLMQYFYSHIKDADTASQSLRLAKLEMIRSKTASHPFYWAGFIITGDADYHIFNSARSFRLYLIAAIILGVALIVIFLFPMKGHL